MHAIDSLALDVLSRITCYLSPCAVGALARTSRSLRQRLFSGGVARLVYDYNNQWGSEVHVVDGQGQDLLDGASRHQCRCLLTNVGQFRRLEELAVNPLQLMCAIGMIVPCDKSGKVAATADWGDCEPQVCWALRTLTIVIRTSVLKWLVSPATDACHIARFAPSLQHLRIDDLETAQRGRGRTAVREIYPRKALGRGSHVVEDFMRALPSSLQTLRMTPVVTKTMYGLLPAGCAESPVRFCWSRYHDLTMLPVHLCSLSLLIKESMIGSFVHTMCRWYSGASPVAIILPHLRRMDLQFSPNICGEANTTATTTSTITPPAGWAKLLPRSLESLTMTNALNFELSHLPPFLSSLKLTYWYPCSFETVDFGQWDAPYLTRLSINGAKLASLHSLPKSVTRLKSDGVDLSLLHQLHGHLQLTTLSIGTDGSAHSPSEIVWPPRLTSLAIYKDREVHPSIIGLLPKHIARLSARFLIAAKRDWSEHFGRDTFPPTLKHLAVWNDEVSILLFDALQHTRLETLEFLAAVGSDERVICNDLSWQHLCHRLPASLVSMTCPIAFMLDVPSLPRLASLVLRNATLDVGRVATLLDNAPSLTSLYIGEIIQPASPLDETLKRALNARPRFTISLMPSRGS